MAINISVSYTQSSFVFLFSHRDVIFQFNVEAENNRGLKNLSLPVGLVGPVFFFFFFEVWQRKDCVVSVFHSRFAL